VNELTDLYSREYNQSSLQNLLMKRSNSASSVKIAMTKWPSKENLAPVRKQVESTVKRNLLSRNGGATRASTTYIQESIDARGRPITPLKSSTS